MQGSLFRVGHAWTCVSLDCFVVRCTELCRVFGDLCTRFCHSVLHAVSFNLVFFLH